MAANIPSDISIQDLRAIVHGLKMATLVSMEDTKLADMIHQRIKQLPSPEAINRLAEDAPAMLGKVKTEIGAIMQLVEENNKRDMVYKIKYKAKTNLDPRYKVLDRRSSMQSGENTFIRKIVKVSALVDDKGQGEVARHLVVCADKMRCGSATEKDFIHGIIMLKKAGFDEEAAALIKEAQTTGFQGFMQGIGDLGKKVKEKVTNVTRTVTDPVRLGKAFSQV
ncbi:MAG: hypothetical protein WC375_11000, partial [Methanomassiliicoccales archaeon]